jgi:hypothetical protein
MIFPTPVLLVKMKGYGEYQTVSLADQTYPLGGGYERRKKAGTVNGNWVDLRVLWINSAGSFHAGLEISTSPVPPSP